MAKLAIIYILFLLSACSSVPLTQEGKKVKIITESRASKCEFVTADSITDASFGAHPGVCSQRAEDRLRNQVADMGGNAYVEVYKSVLPCLMGGTTISFKAYKCP